MTEWHEGEAHSLHDSETTVSRYQRFRGRPDYVLEFPVTDGDIWTRKTGKQEAFAVIDEDTARRLARLINILTGETNE